MINEKWKIDKTFRTRGWTDQKLDKPEGPSGERQTKANLPVKGRVACVAGARKGKGEGKSGAGKRKRQRLQLAHRLFRLSRSPANEKLPLVRF